MLMGRPILHGSQHGTAQHSTAQHGSYQQEMPPIPHFLTHMRAQEAAASKGHVLLTGEALPSETMRRACETVAGPVLLLREDLALTLLQSLKGPDRRTPL